MKKKVGPLCAAESITRPSTSGTTTAAANSTARPRSSMPEGPWPVLPRSPAGDIPREVYPTAMSRRVEGARDLVGGLAADQELVQELAERHRDARPRAAQALAEHRGQHD